MAKKPKGWMRKMSLRVSGVKKDNAIKESLNRVRLSKLSEVERLQESLNKLDSNIKNTESDLQGLFKDNIVIVNKLKLLREQRGTLIEMKGGIKNGIQ